MQVHELPGQQPEGEADGGGGRRPAARAGGGRAPPCAAEREREHPGRFDLPDGPGQSMVDPRALGPEAVGREGVVEGVVGGVRERVEERPQFTRALRARGAPAEVPRRRDGGGGGRVEHRLD